MANSLLIDALIGDNQSRSTDELVDFVTEAASVRLRPLLAYTILQSPGDLSLHEQQRLRAIVHDAIALEALRGQALADVLATLARNTIRTLVVKGAAYGHVGYPRPELRPRHDDDLLVDAAEFEAASAILESIGYARAIEVGGARVTGQRHYHSRRFGLPHYIDLHARPLNPAGFSSLPSFEDLWARRQNVPAIGGAAPGCIDALLLACAHRVAHHPTSEDPIWRLDVHYLSSQLSEDDWPQLTERARSTQIARVVAGELRYSAERWHTAVPGCVIDQLMAVKGERSAAYLDAATTLDVEWRNLRDQARLLDRLSLVHQHLLPSASYMRAQYGPAGPIRLAWLYGRRAIGGGLRWVREQRAHRRAV